MPQATPHRRITGEPHLSRNMIGPTAGARSDIATDLRRLFYPVADHTFDGLVEAIARAKHRCD